MKHKALILLFLGSCFVMRAQNVILPYNPDGNNDQLIGVSDLQDLLAIYGTEFSAAVVSDDGSSAIVNLGNASYPQCLASCRSLPGRWHMATLEEFGLIWTDFLNAAPNVEWDDHHVAWIDHPAAQGAQGGPVPITLIRQTDNGPEIQVDGAPDGIEPLGLEMACYCGVQELRKVEYFTCSANCSEGVGALDDCVNAKAEEGWLPFGSPNQQQVYSTCFWQSMWRWAD